MLTDLGHEVFSMGIYQGSNKGGDLRGEIPNLYDNPELREASYKGRKEDLPQELIDWMDVCISMHNSPDPLGKVRHPQPWLEGNWEKFKKSKKPVIWRSIGQSTNSVEQSLGKFRKEGLKIVRYSPKEANIRDYQGEDAIIRFAEDSTQYGEYSGITPRLVNISQALFGDIEHGGGVGSRGDHMNLPEFKRIVEGFDWKVFGPNNEDAGDHNGGLLSHEDLKQMLAMSRAFVFLGTRPASYTLGFMEASMAGIPVVAIGPNLANTLYHDKTYEVHELIGTSGEAGFWSDNVDELREYCKMLLEDVNLAKSIGAKGRARAISLFGRDSISKQWDEFLNKL